MWSPSIICHQQSSSDLCSAYTCGRPTSSMSSTLVGSTTMLPSNIPSSTGTTARRSAASTMANRSAWPQPSSFPQPLAQPTWLSRTSSPSLSLTPHLLQSSTSPSYISTYKHPANLADPPQMSSNGSINLSTALPAENCTPLLVRLVKSLEPPMSPGTVATTLAAHPDLNGDILRAITKGLLMTIARRDAQEASEICHLKEQICGLHDRVEYYKNTFNLPPDGYEENDG